ncbi:MAG: sialidase family protein [Caldilineaceae bacterium]
MNFVELRSQDPRTQTYLGSPSIVRLPSGDLLATHDYFGPGCPRNHEGEEHLTSVYLSQDDGAAWRNITHIANAYWSSLFLHRGDVYLLGCSQQYGSIVVRRSTDGGYTWTHPSDAHTGLIAQGGFYHSPPNYHCAPTPVLAANGRLYKAFEDCDPCVWGSGFRSLVISAHEDGDLLEAASWQMSNKLAYDPGWTPSEWGTLENPGWLEGNVVETPHGGLCNVLRFNAVPLADKAAIVDIGDDGGLLAFEPATGLIDFPGGQSKFTIRRDIVTGLYLTISNNNTSPKSPRQRNVLSLHKSADLRAWVHVKTLLQDDADLTVEESIRTVGFQYVDWQFDGDNLLYLVRTAYGGAHNYHDSNRITFHTLGNFRKLL